MTRYIATFYTHYAALASYRTLQAHGVSATLAPVPRTLSADCGTCLRYEADTPLRELLHRDFARVVLAADETTVIENHDAV